MMKIALLAPIHNSLYARLVVHQMLAMEDIEVSAIIVRSHWNFKRFRSEFGRDGVRLLRKIYQKLVLGDVRFASSRSENLLSLARELNLSSASLKEIARQRGIPYLTTPDHNQPECVELLEKTAPQLIAFTGGGLIRRNILDIPEIGILNCHTGILPQYRGMDVVEWTAAENKIGEIGFGATLHLMDRGVDSGPIILKKTINPNPGESFAIIRERLEVLMVKLMVEGICGLRDDKLHPQLQKPLDGRQYYVMHPRVKKFTEEQLSGQNC